jgi:hypothetical protein
MQLKPLRRYTRPAYPTIDAIYADPDLLRRVPRRWRGKAIVLAALATAGTLVALHANEAGAANPAHVAPIFQHGNGRGAFGCEAVNPPVFLSEDEARQVIIEEAKRAGLTFTTEAPELKKVAIPVTNEGMGEQKPKNTDGPLKLDLYAKKQKVAVEYVSQDDFKAWEGKDGGPRSSVSSVDILDAATRLRDGLEKAKPAEMVGVLYDPMSRVNYDGKKDWKDSEADAKVAAREELRKQVKDFMAWLKAQGVI